MLIERLDLIAYGHFSGLSLSLGSGMHVVYGPNEAGKSTTLRAIRQLLYGFDENNTDDFLHSYTNQRVGAVLRDPSGAPLNVIRRKGRKNTLRQADDVTVIEESVLAELLAGIDEHAFRQRYGIDYEQLVDGGREIARGQGDLGQMLFAAGAGLTDLSAIQSGLANESEALFKSGGKNPRINQSLAELQTLRKRIKESLLSTSDWQEADKALSDARTRLIEVADQLRSLETERDRLRRWQQALPAISKRDDSLAKLQQYGDVPRLSKDFGERRLKAQAALRHADQDRIAAKNVLDKIVDTLNQTTVAEDLLDREDEVTKRVTEWGAYLKAQQDRPRLVEKLRLIDADVARMLGELNLDPNGLEIASLTVSKALRTRITKLSSERDVQVASQDRANREVEQLRKSIGQTRRQLDGCKLPESIDDLRRAVKLAREAGPLDAQVLRARTELQRLQQQANACLSRLGLWQRSLDDLERAAFPSIETIDRSATQFESLHDELRIWQARERDLSDQLERLHQQLEQLQLQQDVPTEADLKAAREERDLGWSLIRRAFDIRPTKKGAAAADDDLESRAFISRWPNTRSLLDAYEQSVAQTDQLADRLRREADRVAQRVQLEADRAAMTRQQADAATRLHDAGLRLDEFTVNWREQWSSLGTVPLSPREMRVWLQERDDLIEQSNAIRRQASALSELEETRQGFMESLAVHLGRRGEASSLADLLAEAEERLTRDDSIRKQHEQLQQELERLLSQEQSVQNELRDVEPAFANWQQQWAAALHELSLPASATPDEAAARLEAINDLIDEYREAQSLKERLDGIDADARTFEDKFRLLAAAVLPGQADQPMDVIATRLQSELTTARRNSDKRRALLDQQRQYEEQLAQAQRRHGDSESDLRDLCQQAKAASVDELASIEVRAEEYKQLDEELSRINDRLRELAPDGQIEPFIDTARSCDAERLPIQLSELEERVANLGSERDSLNVRLGSLEQRLSEMDGGSIAADAELEERQVIAKIQFDAMHYARLRLAAAVLREAIERYRQQSQGPVLTTASEMFADLTLGSFSGLRIEPSEKGDPRLVGVRPDGRLAVDVNGMSEGTCDQLYLALRLASLHQDVGPRRHLPLVIDDILIQFDDERARAALRVLHQVSAERQVIFFTHHEHLLALAREALPADSFATHTLPRNSV